MYKDLKNKKEVNLKIKRIAKENQIPFIERQVQTLALQQLQSTVIPLVEQLHQWCWDYH
jgi:hypothetical protein